MKLLIYTTMFFTALLSGKAAEVALRIYTPVGQGHRIISLKEDWTMETRTKEEFVAENSDYGERTIPKGHGNKFAMTGRMTWSTGQFDKRAFWVARGDRPEGGDTRDMLKCIVHSTQPLTDDVYVYLSPNNWVYDVSWTDKAKCDTLDMGWLHCVGPKGEWNDKHFTKPDDTELWPGKNC